MNTNPIRYADIRALKAMPYYNTGSKFLGFGMLQDSHLYRAEKYEDSGQLYYRINDTRQYMAVSASIQGGWLSIHHIEDETNGQRSWLLHLLVQVVWDALLSGNKFVVISQLPWSVYRKFKKDFRWFGFNRRSEPNRELSPSSVLSLYNITAKEPERKPWWMIGDRYAHLRDLFAAKQVQERKGEVIRGVGLCGGRVYWIETVNETGGDIYRLSLRQKRSHVMTKIDRSQSAPIVEAFTSGGKKMPKSIFLKRLFSYILWELNEPIDVYLKNPQRESNRFLELVWAFNGRYEGQSFLIKHNA